MVTTIGKTTTVTGTVYASEAIAISGTVRGDVVVLNHHVTVEPDGNVDGAVTAREITILGTSTGRLVATELVYVQANGRVTADIAAPKLAMEDGAIVNGRVEPARAAAAARVAAYRRNGGP